MEQGVRYISTRGEAPILEFDEVLLAGLATDGGLYIPESWPQFSADEIRAMRGLSYVELATRIMLPFLGGRIADDDFAALVRDAYSGFDHAATVPLKQLDDNMWLMELFHGPTLAFKDVALQLLGRLFDHVLTRRGERITIVGATSGDTGSAAIEACRDREAIDIFILHPHGRVSDVQRRQMTTVPSANVHNIAVEGSFDDCQDMVKAMFGNADFRREMRLGGQLDQLGVDHGPDRLLFPGRTGPGRAGSARGIRRADRQFRECLCRLRREADGSSYRPVRDRIEPQRYPHPLY